MNKEIKALWISALRSGEYEQGQLGLKVDANGRDTYCCLGVLCDLAVKAGVGEWSGEAHTFGDDRNSVYLTSAVRDWSGVTEQGQLINEYGELQVLSMYGTWNRYSLAQMNDGGDSFEAIADVIEQKF